MGLLSSYVTSCIERKSGARQRPKRRKVPIGLHFGMVPCFHTQLCMHFFENTSVGTTQINCRVLIKCIRINLVFLLFQNSLSIFVSFGYLGDGMFIFFNFTNVYRYKES